MTWYKYIIDHKFEIIIITSIVLLLLLYLFRNPIQKWLDAQPIIDLHKLFSYPPPSSPKKILKNETRCREIFEKLFRVPFVSIRPTFLKNHSTGRNLELDGYNEQLKLAFEYNGMQHYKYSPKFHRKEEDLIKQKERDVLKKQKCKDNNITLIEIPYNIGYDKLESYIINELKKHGHTF